ncbi:hypothetical protein [Sphingobium nicotianae]|uniref:hypothetical protein n=1 Tax=Sphingobium nicotianae TaxID=2782607 RepID=UPI001BE491AA|nr:hypothetical protein [Sphingobium nicotianae]
MTFGAPFHVRALDATLPAGPYEVATEEEAIEGNALTAYVRVATLLTVRTGSLVQTVTVDPADLADGVWRPA